MDIKPIKTRKDYKEAMKKIESLMDAKPNTAEGDMLDVLTTLVEAYEQRHFPIEAPSAVAAIEFAMEQQGLKRKDIEPYIGSRSRVSEVLSRKRQLTLPMIRKLHAGLGIPAEILITNTP